MIAKRLLAIQKASSPPAPAATDVYYDYRSLILNMQGSAGSTTFTDSSPNNFTVTPYGNAQLTTDVTFGTVGTFDGSTYLLGSSGIPFSFGTGDFTVEYWFNASSLPPLYNYRGICGNSDSSTTMGFGISSPSSNNFRIGATTQTVGYVGNSNIAANVWYHAAFVRQSGILKLYLNGVLDGTFTVTTNLSNTQFYIINSNASYRFRGLLGPLRVSPWAVYKSNFTPSANLFPAAPDSIYANPYYDKVALSLKFDGTNGSTSFVDTGPNAFPVTPSGNAQITSASKYGSGAGAFDGSGDYLQVSNNALYNFGSSNFTIEGWIYPVTSSGERVIVAKNEGSYTTGFEWWLGILGSNNLQFTFVNASATFYSVTSSTTIPANTWTHVSVVRSGSTITLFVNGVISGTTTSQTIRATASNVSVSRDLENLGGGRYLNGSIDELEITPGVAKYKANFTPPVRGLSTIYNPYTTLPVPGAALWLDGADSSTLFTDAGVTPVTKSGDLIYQWSDKSGNNRHATQATSGNRPTWVPPASGQNGFGVIGFNRANSQWLLCQNASVTVGTIYIVYFHATGNALYSSFMASFTSSFSGGPPASDISFRLAVPSSNFDTNVALHSNNFSSISSRLNRVAVSSQFYQYTAGQSINTSNRATLLSHSMTPKTGSWNFALGQDVAAASRFANMNFCELIVFPETHNQSQIDAMESYLKSKWGTP